MALPGDQALKYTSLGWPFLFKPPDKHQHLLDSVIENYIPEDNLSPKKGVWELTKSNVTGRKGDKIEDGNLSLPGTRTALVHSYQTLKIPNLNASCREPHIKGVEGMNCNITLKTISNKLNLYLPYISKICFNYGS